MTFPAPPDARSIGARFEEVARRFADRRAVSGPAGVRTFAELDAETAAIAAGLLELAPGTAARPIALLGAHDVSLVVGIVAIIRSGHILVVLDPTAPPDVLAAGLAEASPAAVVHDGAFPEVLAQLRAVAPDVEVAALDELARPPVDLPVRGPGDPAMLAFTSGTTGVSKGATITHGVLLNLVRGASEALDITAEDCLPMLFPTSLAVAAYPMFLPLLNGGTLATLDVRSVGLAPVAEFLQRERISVVYLAPTVVRFLADALGGSEFPDLRMVALGGEPADAEVVRLTADLFEPRQLANGFGTTETGVIALHVFDPADPPAGQVPAGRPVPDVELSILDDRGDALPAGEAGEIALAGPYLFSGYWGHPDLSDAVLSADPEGRPGWRLYRTGDLGRLDPDGTLTVIGRIDTKVKIRGRFVVLGDVEAEVRALAEVADAAVTAGRDEGITHLTAHVVPAAGRTVDPQALRAALLATHEPYRVPARWVVHDELPRLPNGKLDRRALETTTRARSTPAGPDVEPGERARIQRELRAIWEELLPVSVVAPGDDFLLLGGDSLAAARMVILAEERLGVGIAMGDLVAARTLDQLTDRVVELTSSSTPRPLVSRLQAGDGSDRPTLWFVPDLQGSAYRVRHLAHHLGADQPVWSFESPLMAGTPNPFTSLETFAARLLTDLRAVQPEGPYWLAGYCFGGICAYEMARQLVSEGDEVAYLGIVDVGPGYRGPGWGDHRSPLRPWFGIAPPPPAGSSVRDVARHYRAMAAQGPERVARHLMMRSGLARVVDPLRFRLDLRRTGAVRPEWRLWYAWEEHWRLAAKAWSRTNTYPGRVELFWAADSPSSDASLGWEPLVGELEIHRVPGDHEGLLEPSGAPALAEALRRSLDDAIRLAPCPAS